MNYACVNKTNKVVIINIEWNGETYVDPNITDTCDLIPWDENTKGCPVSPGFTYDEVLQGFIPPNPQLEKYPNYIFDTIDWLWVGPTPRPEGDLLEDEKYIWSDVDQIWKKFKCDEEGRIIIKKNN